MEDNEFCFGYVGSHLMVGKPVSNLFNLGVYMGKSFREIIFTYKTSGVIGKHKVK